MKYGRAKVQNKTLFWGVVENLDRFWLTVQFKKDFNSLQQKLFMRITLTSG